MGEEQWKEYLKEEKEGKKLLGILPKERVYKVQIKRPRKGIAEEFLKLEDVSATVSDVLDSMGLTKNVISATTLKPMNPGQKVAGPAITAHNLPDITSVGLGYEKKLLFKHGTDREAYQVAEPGDVIVIDGEGYDIANMGALSATVAKARGCAGNIIYGSVRDVEAIRKIGYPVWASGHTPVTGKYRYEGIAINGPVKLAGVRVNPGDFVVADDSGVSIIPSDIVEEVLEEVKKLTEVEDQLRDFIEKHGYDIERIMELTKKRYIKKDHE